MFFKPIPQIPVCLHCYNYQSHIQKVAGEFTAWRPASGEFARSRGVIMMCGCAALLIDLMLKGGEKAKCANLDLNNLNT